MYQAREFYFLFAAIVHLTIFFFFPFSVFILFAWLSLLAFCFLYHHSSTLVSFPVHYIIYIGKLKYGAD